MARRLLTAYLTWRLKRIWLLTAIALIGFSSEQRTDSLRGKRFFFHDYPIKAVPFYDVDLTDQFWKPRIDSMFTVTIPHELDELRNTGRNENFVLAAARLKTAEDSAHFCTQYPFDDTDLYKVIQGISYLLQIRPDSALKASMDSLIELIAAAQEPDGYLYTARTVNPLHPPEWSGLERWVNVEKLSHELYCSGHLFQAAAANYVATGDTRLLHIAIKNADLLCKTFGWGKLEKYPGHPEVELGLVSLYHVTGNKRYLDLAQFFLDVRGPGGDAYEQAQQKVTDQRKAVGHAVRAGYLYSAMADVSALTGNNAYLNADNYIWQDIVSSQIYVTGGIGSTSNGEAFGQPYRLPNMTAYNETCASIANVYFNERMFLSHGDAKYYDVLERTLYNALLSGLSLKGDEFFYPNPLESRGQYERSPWFGCACCPTNLARFLPTVAGYFYAMRGDEIFVNLYGANSATLSLQNQTVVVKQQTDYPRSGNIIMYVEPEKAEEFTIRLRIPGWATDKPIPGDLYAFKNKQPGPWSIEVNGKQVPTRMQDGYAVIRRIWSKGDEMVLTLPMDVRLITANSSVKDDHQKIALQRGPLVYCLEGPDNPDDKVLNAVVNPDQAFTTSFRARLLNGVTVIKAKAEATKRTRSGKIEATPEEVTAIPYYTWANRGGHEMTVWIPTVRQAARPTAAPTIANTSTITAFRPSRSLIALNDQILPKNSNDHAVMYFHWWPLKDTTVWVEYDFSQPAVVSSSAVYWYDDSSTGGGCSLPDGWRVLYKKNNHWLPVNNITPYERKKDQNDRVHFEPIETKALKMQIRLNKHFSAGIYEWEVK